jgi:hypothetical protein
MPLPPDGDYHRGRPPPGPKVGRRSRVELSGPEDRVNQCRVPIRIDDLQRAHARVNGIGVGPDGGEEGIAQRRAKLRSTIPITACNGANKKPPGRSLARQVVEIVAPQLRIGGFVMNDNGEHDYMECMRSPENGFLSITLPIKRGTTVSVKVT